MSSRKRALPKDLKNSRINEYAVKRRKTKQTMMTNISKMTDKFGDTLFIVGNGDNKEEIHGIFCFCFHLTSPLLQ